MLMVVERSLGGTRADTTRRAFDMTLLRKLAKPSKDEDPELMLVEASIERQVVNKKGEPKFNDDGSPKMRNVTVLEIQPYKAPVREADTLPVRQEDGSEPDPSATQTPAVREADTSRPPGGHEPFNRTLPKPFDSPPTPQGGEGDFKSDWIEDLRAEGQAPVVLDSFLIPLLKAGLKPWKDTDPKGPARQLCQDFKRRSAEVLTAAADRCLSTEKYRLPPVAKCREAVETEGKIAAAKVFHQRKQESDNGNEIQRFDKGTPEFETELARWRVTDPVWAAKIEENGFVKLRRKDAA